MKNKIILGIAGEIASGKDTVTEFLEEKYGAKKYRMSDSLKDILSALHLTLERNNFATLSLALRKNFGQDILLESLIAQIKERGDDFAIVDGVRRIEELDVLQQEENFKFIYLKADLEMRYKRLKDRSEKSDDALKTFEEFKKDQELESEKTIADLEKKADMVIVNDGSLEDLYKKVDDYIKNI